MRTEKDVQAILRRVEEIPGVSALTRARGFDVIAMRIVSRKNRIFSGLAYIREGRIIVRIPTPIEECDIAYIAALVTHEVAHIILPSAPAHGPVFRSAWCALLSDLLGHDVKWPTEARRRLSLEGAFYHFSEVVQESIDHGDLVL